MVYHVFWFKLAWPVWSMYGVQNHIGLILSKARQKMSETWATGSWMGSFMMPFWVSAQVFIVYTIFAVKAFSSFGVGLLIFRFLFYLFIF